MKKLFMIVGVLLLTFILGCDISGNGRGDDSTLKHDKPYLELYLNRSLVNSTDFTNGFEFRLRSSGDTSIKYSILPKGTPVNGWETYPPSQFRNLITETINKHREYNEFTVHAISTGLGKADSDELVVTLSYYSPPRIELISQRIRVAQGADISLTSSRYRYIPNTNIVDIVTWEIDGTKTGTRVASNNRLYIANNEPLGNLELTVKSIYGTSDTTIVEVISPDPPISPAIVTNILIYPNSPNSIEKGTSIYLTAVVMGINTPPQGVTWSTNSIGSIVSIDSSTGKLYIPNDVISTSVMVTATSTFDTSKSNTIPITIIQ